VSTLLVASTGGHLKQLHHLHRRLSGVSGPFRWATFDTPQSRSLLDGEEVDFVPFVGGRDPLNVGRNFLHAERILRRRRVETLVSTGSAVALPFFALGRAKRLEAHYIESAARIEGPSLTGKIIRRIPGVHRYAQYTAWADSHWAFGGSVFDSFARSEAPGSQTTIAKAVVSLGSYRGFGFPRLIERLLQILPPEVEVLWQTGDTDVTRFSIEGRRALPERELVEAMREADVVIAHAGVGAALAAFETGKCPVLVPRRLSRGEHIDDHQIQIAEELDDRDLAISVDASELSLEHLLEAMRSQVSTRVDPPPFRTANAKTGPAPR
jgi:UDP-N-acetylglucosamine--N-acetylmuramyl-(pentapeptide) pyrophosphoryl-undecaprenol N-acetylglucosamine transferase